MSITSYAQNFEDVMLWRALSHVEHGFYIDVGAQDPIIDSVSLVFHEHGWSGIHVEPLQRYADMLKQQRPGDTVIQAAVGNGPAVLHFFEIPGTGISTAAADIAAQHRERGFDVRDIAVPCITLASILDAAAEPEIHWLKVDVEGFEQQVLASWGASRARPWIVVVESTLPLTQIETHGKWESILVSYGYKPTYFDGLNRYYVSEAHPELRAAFAVPPNIFDDFALNGTANAPFHRLIVSRDQERISEALALAQVQKRAGDSELDRLTQSAASREAAHAERERGLLEEASQARQDSEHIRSSLTRQERDFAARLQEAQQQAATREKEFGAQLLAIQQQAALEIAEQARLRDEQERAMRRQLDENADQARREMESILNTLVQREREFSAHLLLIQDQSARERAEQFHLRREQESAIHSQHAERERSLNQQLQDTRQERRSLERDRVQREHEHAEQIDQLRQALESVLNREVKREREIAALLLATQQEAHRESNEQATRHLEQVLSLQNEHAKRQQALSVLLEAKQLELRQSEATRKSTQNQFDEQLHAEREISKVRQDALRALQLDLATLRNSLSWRLTSPLRKVKDRLTHTRAQSSSANTPSEKGVTTPPEHHLLAIAEPYNQQHKSDSTRGDLSMTPDDPTRTTSFTRLIAAQDLNTLLGHHGRQFVECAYLTLLNRQPDPGGMLYYLQRLRSGAPKLQILRELYTSDEGRMSGADLPWLRKITRWQTFSRIPLIGRIPKFFISRQGAVGVETQLRIVEQQVFWLEELFASQLAPLKESSAEFRSLIKGVHTDAILTNKISASMISGEPNAANEANATLEPPGFDQLSPSAKKVYIKLRIAAAKTAQEVI